MGAVCQATVQGPGGALCQPGPQPGRGNQDGGQKAEKEPRRPSELLARQGLGGDLLIRKQKGVREGGGGSSALGSGRIIDSVGWGVEKEMREFGGS